MRFQQNQMSLIEIAKEKTIFIKQFHEADKTFSLISKHGRIVISKQIQKKPCRMVS